MRKLPGGTRPAMPGRAIGLAGGCESAPRSRRRAVVWLLTALLAATSWHQAVPAQAQLLTPESPEVKAAIQRGVQRLIDHKQHSSPGRLYLAALAIAKAGQTDHPKVQQALQSIKSVYGGETQQRPDYEAVYRTSVAIMLLTTLDQCNLALRYVRHLRPQRRINANPAYSSYALKHAAERYLQRLSPDSAAYVSHGAFICAALFAGFLFERQSRDSLSVVFNVSDQSPIFEWERLLQSDSHDTEARRIALERQLGIEPVGAAAPDNGTGVRH